MATIRDLARWGYNNYGASLDFRKTEIWSILDPLVNSPFVPKDWGKLEDVLDRTQKNFKQEIEKRLNFESPFGVGEIPPDYESSTEAEIEEFDYLGEEPTFTADEIKVSTSIDYQVFFQE